MRTPDQRWREATAEDGQRAHEVVCWIWTGYLDGERPRIHTSEGMRDAKRWVYEREVAPIPEGHVLFSLCRNGRCVRPRHHEPVTHEESTIRHGRRKLTSALGRRIVLLVKMGASMRTLAAIYGVDPETIRNVVHGRHWTTREPR